MKIPGFKQIHYIGRDAREKLERGELLIFERDEAYDIKHGDNLILETGESCYVLEDSILGPKELIEAMLSKKIIKHYRGGKLIWEVN